MARVGIKRIQRIQRIKREVDGKLRYGMVNLYTRKTRKATNPNPKVVKNLNDIGNELST